MTTPAAGAPTAAYLAVTAGGRRVGLPVEEVIEVRLGVEVRPVPAAAAAFRGVAALERGLVPVVHLGALLADERCPDAREETLVVTEITGRRIALEVEAADVVRRDPVIAQAGDALPWVRAVAAGPDGYVPLLDLGALAARLTEMVP